MTPRKLPRQGRGQPIRAADLNRERGLVEGLARAAQAGISVQTTVANQPLALRAGRGPILLGKAPSGGIAAGATATVTLYQHGSVTTLGTATLEVTNPGPDACPGSKKVWIGEVNGKANTVLWWSCANA